MRYAIAVNLKYQRFRHAVRYYVGLKNLNNMDLQKKDYTELQALFEVVFKDWQATNLDRKRILDKECITYDDFVRERADLRRLAKENVRLHNKLLEIDLELQIRTWTGLND